MDKSCQSTADSTSTVITTTSTANNTSGNTATATNTTTHNNNRDTYLRQLNKLSQKITKPVINKKPTFEPPPQNHTFNNNNQAPNQPLPSQQNLQHQPPVYNINKNDFRDVVQKLTGSPAHERISTVPPPIQQPKPPSSRLQRIRPPPLAQLSNRPPPTLLNSSAPRPQPPPHTAISGNLVHVNSFSGFGRPVTAPLSPLPPFPTVHAAAESPVSAYMRYLHSSMLSMDSNSKQFSGFSPLAPLVSPRWNNFAPQEPQQEQQSQPPHPLPHQQIPPPPQQGIVSSQSPSTAGLSQLQFPMPSSPAPFGCLNSPLSSYPLLSPGLLFSPNSGQLGFPQLPLSPTVPVPSPRWRGI